MDKVEGEVEVSPDRDLSPRSTVGHLSLVQGLC